MNCKTCNYSLWNNKTGQCPECGTPFKPSDFDFIPGTVRFCCPHCSQQYFGTDSRGHLEPRAFTCVTCNIPIEMDQMILMPETGVPEDATQVAKVAWTDETLGFFPRWWRTIWGAMIRPHLLGTGIPPGQGALQAWWFAILTNLVITFSSFAFLLVLFPLIFALTPKGTPTPPIWAMSMGIGGFVLGVALVGYPLFILFWGLAAHLILHIGPTKPAHSLRHTYKTICYASGANFINLIPCVGMYSVLGGLWWTVAAIISLKFSQKVSTTKAVMAGLIPPLLVVSTCAASYLSFLFVALPKMSQAVSAAQAQAMTQANLALDFTVTGAVTQSLKSAAVNTGSWPSHVAILVMDRSLNDTSFTLTASGTTSNKIPLAGTTLSQAAFLPTSEEKRLAAAFASSSPPPVYRFGDFVFTYQGVPVTTPTEAPGSRTGYGDLWIVISSVDPTSPPPTTPQFPVFSPFGTPPATTPAATPAAPAMPRTIYVGTATGSIVPIAPASFATALAEQNALRATYGLPPIPAPETIPQWTLPAPK